MTSSLELALKLSAPVLLAYVSARLAAQFLRWVGPRASGDEDLTSFVSFTSRLIAAYRALETEQEDALFQDHLAKQFAGDAATRRARRHNTEEYASVQPHKYDLPPADPGRPRRLGIFTLRTLYFDQAILKACRGQALGKVAHKLQIKQVVMLGAGMDARPWRLDLPDQVRWWEVDQPDVMAAKQAILRRAGASLSQADNAHASFQLRAASCSFTGADLVAPGWTQRLVSAGLDPGEPTLWHAEGLLNYLSAEGIQTMLQDAAQVSAPGSLLTATMVNAADTALHVSSPDAHAAEIAQSRQWGASASASENEAFFQSCHWQVLRLDEVASIASDTAPGFEYNCGPAHKAPEDFQYFFMLASPLRHPG